MCAHETNGAWGMGKWQIGEPKRSKRDKYSGKVVKQTTFLHSLTRPQTLAMAITSCMDRPDPIIFIPPKFNAGVFVRARTGGRTETENVSFAGLLLAGWFARMH